MWFLKPPAFCSQSEPINGYLSNAGGTLFLLLHWPRLRFWLHLPSAPQSSWNRDLSPAPGIPDPSPAWGPQKHSETWSRQAEVMQKGKCTKRSWLLAGDYQLTEFNCLPCWHRSFTVLLFKIFTIFINKVTHIQSKTCNHLLLSYHFSPKDKDCKRW